METPKPLSQREKEVVALLLQGKSNKQMATMLGISERTVEFHLTRIYHKLQVNSRIEAILKLGKPAVVLEGQPGESTVVEMAPKGENHDQPVANIRRAFTLREAISLVTQESNMKRRWLIYTLAGFLFGVGFWHYFSGMAQFLNTFETANPLNETWARILLPVVLFVYLGIWLIPTFLPAFYEYRSSKTKRLAVFSAITVLASAVLGYYVNYIVLLAFVGLPHMDFLLVSQRTASFWQDWTAIFPKLILFDYLKWTAASMVLGGIAGWATASFLSWRITYRLSA